MKTIILLIDEDLRIIQSIISELRGEVASSAIGPDRMLCIPMRNVLACALATLGAASRLAAPLANIVRRVMNPLIELHLP
jgi:hypothetical protein